MNYIIIQDLKHNNRPYNLIFKKKAKRKSLITLSLFADFVPSS
jgi:hypothetical protein